MHLTSPAFTDNASIPQAYTCDGENLSPPLEFHDVPEGTISLALIVDDPDAPGGLWTHWLAWNIPATTTHLEAGRLPSEAIEGTGSGRTIGYQGPCPPHGEHRYIFHAYAVDVELKLPPESTRPQLAAALAGHILAEATLTARYARA